jgi:hypothetical protein
MLAQMTANPNIRTFRTMAWDKVWEEVYVPAWREMVSKHIKELRGIRPADIPKMLGDLAKFGQKFTSPSELPPVEELKRRGIQALGMALGSCLHDHGWRLEVGENDLLSFNKDEWTIRPFEAINNLAVGELSAEEWTRQCEQMGIADWDMGTLQTEVQASS